MSSFRQWGTGSLAALALVLAAEAPAVAQTVIGGDTRPSVEVDTGVLDRLGGTQTLPDLFLDRHPPGMVAPAAALPVKPAAHARSHKATAVVLLHRPSLPAPKLAKVKPAAVKVAQAEPAPQIADVPKEAPKPAVAEPEKTVAEAPKAAEPAKAEAVKTEVKAEAKPEAKADKHEAVKKHDKHEAHGKKVEKTDKAPEAKGEAKPATAAAAPAAK